MKNVFYFLTHIYMYNKFISLFILITLFWWIYYFFYYFFVLNKWGLTLTLNVSDYQVSLYTDKLKTSFSSNCKKEICELIDLAPFDYEITIKKDWYKDYTKNIKIQKKSTMKLNINLEKQISIQPITSSIIETSEKLWSNNHNQLEKFREISFLQKSYIFFDLPDLGYFYFLLNNDSTITLFHKKDWKSTQLYSFQKIEKSKLDIQKIYQSYNLILIVYGDEKYIYNLNSGTIEKVFFPQRVNYVKQYLNTFSFVNDKGTFVYDMKNNHFEYFYLFKDFIQYDENNYFWVIYKDEIEKKKNYNLQEYKDTNLIVKYNFHTKNIKVLETTSQNIYKIVKEDDTLYFYDISWEKYLVNNIE